MAEVVQTTRVNVLLVTYCQTSGWPQMKSGQGETRDRAEAWGMAEGVTRAARDPRGCGAPAV